MRKYIIAVLLLVFVGLKASAQEPRPEWANNQLVSPRRANFILVFGMGIGANESEALFKAKKEAMFKALEEGGLLGFKSNSKSLDEVMSMEQLEVVIPQNMLPRKQICQSRDIYLKNGMVKVYVLYQVQKNAGLPNDFNEYGQIVTCESSEFLNKLKEWNAAEDKRREEKRKKELAEEKKEQLRAISPFYKKNHNSYLLWGIVESGYPFNVSTSFVGRHLGGVGVGYYATVGVSINGEYDPLLNPEADDKNVSFDMKTIDFKSGFNYSAGLRFYMYKTGFVSAGYGTYGYKRTFNSKNSDKDVWEQKSGLQFAVGVDWLGDMTHSGWGLSIEGGVLFSQFGVEPLLKAKLCFGWGL